MNTLPYSHRAHHKALKKAWSLGLPQPPIPAVPVELPLSTRFHQLISHELTRLEQSTDPENPAKGLSKQEIDTLGKLVRAARPYLQHDSHSLRIEALLHFLKWLNPRQPYLARDICDWLIAYREHYKPD